MKNVLSPDNAQEKLNQALLDAAKEGRVDEVRALIGQGADVHVKDNFKNTSLRLAVSRGHAPVVELLLEKGAALEEKDSNGFTLLHWAVSRGHAPVVALLLENGANHQAKGNHGHTPLHWAASFGNRDIVKILIENDAKVDVKDDNGATPLHCAFSRAHMDAVDILLAKGANPLPHDEAFETFKELFDLKTAALKDIRGEASKALLKLLDDLLDRKRSQDQTDTLIQQCTGTFSPLLAVRELVDGIKELEYKHIYPAYLNAEGAVHVQQNARMECSESFFFSMVQGIRHFYPANKVPEQDILLAARGAALHLREEIREGIRAEESRQQALEGLKQENAHLLALLAQHGISVEGAPSHSKDKGKEEAGPSSWAGRVAPVPPQRQQQALS